MARHLRQIYKFFAWIVIVFIGLVVVASVSYETWLKTAHPVIPQKIYRSAQLSPRELAYAIKTRQIKTVINLRGLHPQESWYQQELATTQRLGVKLENLQLSSYQLPTQKEIQQLVHLIQTSPQPVLIHCRGGADRSGFASAVALILLTNASLAESERQFSWQHLAFHNNSVGKLVFPYYQAWLTKHQLPHSRENFLKWLFSREPFETNKP